MRCETCQGTGLELTVNPSPCPICQGSTVAYCCDDAGSNQPNVGDKRSDALARAIFTAAAIVLLAYPLAGCVTSSKVTVSPRIESPRLPAMPTRIRNCFGSLSNIPVKNMSGSELTRVLARVRQSEARKSRCGRDVIQWYDGVRRSYGPR
jgi:hypothetical protein